MSGLAYITSPHGVHITAPASTPTQRTSVPHFRFFFSFTQNSYKFQAESLVKRESYFDFSTRNNYDVFTKKKPGKHGKAHCMPSRGSSNAPRSLDGISGFRGDDDGCRRLAALSVGHA